MIQIIRENRRPSTSERFNSAVGAGLQGASSIMQERAQRLAMQKEDEAAKRLGVDLSGIQNPNIRQKAVELAMQGQQKQQQMGQKQDFLSSLFGGQQPQQQRDLASAGQPQQQSPSQFQGDQQQQMEQGFNPAEIPDEAIVRASAVDPVMGRELRAAKDTALREKREEVKAKQKTQETQRKEIIEFHKESAKYDEDLLKHTKTAKNQGETIASIEKAIKSGNIKPSSLANIFKGFGDIGNKISNAILNKDQATLLASIPSLLEGWKEVFGVRLSDADLKLLQDKLPDIGKSPESNKAILNVMKKYSKMTMLRSQIASDIKSKNKGLRPLGYPDLIEQRFDEMVKPVRIVNPKTGNIIEIPAYEMGDAIKAGATVADE